MHSEGLCHGKANGVPNNQIRTELSVANLLRGLCSWGISLHPTWESVEIQSSLIPYHVHEICVFQVRSWYHLHGIYGWTEGLCYTTCMCDCFLCNYVHRLAAATQQMLKPNPWVMRACTLTDSSLRACAALEPNHKPLSVHESIPSMGAPHFLYTLHISLHTYLFFLLFYSVTARVSLTMH